MGIGYWLNKELGLTVEVWDGDVTADDCRRHLIELAEDPLWPPGLREIIDVTTLGDLSLPDPELVNMLVEAKNLLDDIKLVLVLTPDDLYPKREARWNAVRALPVMSFTDLDRASTFLDVDQATVRAIVADVREALRGEARPA
jgi:hypothetical protein